MKKLLLFSTVILVFSVPHVIAQFKIIQPSSNNFTIMVLGRDGVPLYEAKVTARGNEFLTNHEGQVEYKNQLPNVVSVSASGYLTKNVDLRKYPQGSIVSVQLAKLADINKVLNVYVKDKMGKPLEGAAVFVSPGVSGVTDASGYAKAEHKQQPGEYIEVTVSANGYNDQQKRVLVGIGQGNAITQPEDIVRFTLQSSSSSKTLPLIVEVYDGSNFKPLGSVYVEVKVAGSGATAHVSTDQNGEARFTVNEGDHIKIIARHKGYKEKWSDIPVELLEQGQDRRYTVYLEPDKEASPISVPDVIKECESGCCGTLTRQGNQFKAVWSNGAKATLIIEQFDNNQVILTRNDLAESVSKNFSAKYTGKLSGNQIIEGKVTWTQNGRSWFGTWTASW